jgi:hypothetical protein
MEYTEFTINYDGEDVTVKKVVVNDVPVYVLRLFNKTWKLTVAKTKDYLEYWTFLPAGNRETERLAQRIGKLIKQVEDK